MGRDNADLGPVNELRPRAGGRRVSGTMLTCPAAAIAVPVRNEAARLPRLLHALAGQRGAPAFVLCLFFDNCTDGSRSIAEAMAPSLPFAILSEASVSATPPNAGRARAAAGLLALAQSPRLALLTTDADSEPAGDWLAENVRALDQAEIVAGRPCFRAGALAPVQARLIEYLDTLHVLRRQIDPVGWEAAESHHWTSATSLGVRPGTYRDLGGFAPLPVGEDADMADRGWRMGYRLRRDARVGVRTSARRVGRAAGGFAAALARSDHNGALPCVGHPADEAWRYRHHAWARRSFAGGDVALLTASLGLCPADVGRVAADVPNADAFAARIVGAPPGGMRQVSLDRAELLLAELNARPLEQAA